MFADVYRECLKVGLNPRDVDELHLWEVAVMLGADVEHDPAREEDPHALLRARLAHAEGRAPKPEAAPMTQIDFQALTQSLGMASV